MSKLRLLLIFFFLLGTSVQSQVVARLSGAVYYVDVNHPQASDSNPGTESLPWKTIAKANSTLQAGDTVYIRQGTYYDDDNTDPPNNQAVIQPKNSGTPGNPITYSNYNGETVSIVGAVDRSAGILLDGKSYIVVKGIHFSNLYKFLWIIGGSHHNEIAYCTFQYNRPRSDGVPVMWRGSTIYQNSQYNHIHHSVFSDYGDYLNGDDNGVVFEMGNEYNPHDLTSHNLIENNLFYHGGHHTFGMGGQYNVVRNNYFHNEEWWNGYGNQVVFSNGAGGNDERNLFEGNRIAFGAHTVEPDQVGGIGMKLCTSRNIVRHNVIYLNKSTGLFLTRYPPTGMVIENHIYNNTLYHNAHNSHPNATSEMKHGIFFNIQEPGPVYSFIYGNVLKNNILYDNADGNNDGSAIVRDHYWLYPLLNQTIANNWDENGDPFFVDITSPVDPFDPHLPDFNLRSDSPGIDNGAFLTTVASLDGSGTQFQVEDAGYFMDGWGIPHVQGDEIQLAGGQRARIISVDYATNMITVDRVLAWTQNQGVALAYEGAAPDIGAYEFVPSLILHSSPGNQAIHLSWEVNATMPPTSTWSVEYYTQTATIYTATDPLSTTRSLVLTENVYNYQWYTVTLSAMLGSTPWLSDTVRVMPTDRFVYLPLVLR